MIITRTPFRVSFVGGGSDLPAYYNNSQGSVVSASINKYVYINIHKSFNKEFRLSYSKTEHCSTVSQIEHPLIKNSLTLFDNIEPYEITSISDIPSNGSGLGSSSSFTVGLINALAHQLGQYKSKDEIADLACKVELDLCKSPIGKQDQYAAAYGGFNNFEFTKSGVTRDKIYLSDDNFENINQHCIFFYTGKGRSANKILSNQTKRTNAKENLNHLDKMVELVPEFTSALKSGSLKICGELLNENWLLKKQLSDGITNSNFDDIYNIGINNGAYGGKILGAGGGGFFLFMAPPSSHTRIMKALNGLKREYWRFENVGTTKVYES